MLRKDRSEMAEVVDTLSDEQKRLVNEAKLNSGVTLNYYRLIGDFYLANALEKQIDRAIVSNEELARSNEKYSKAANRLTVGLLVVAALQVIVQVVVPLVKSWCGR